MKLPLKEFSDIVAALRAPSLANSEQRAATRLTVTARINAHLLSGGQITRTYSLLTRDISLTGLGVFQTVALGQGSELVVELPTSNAPLLVRSVVMFCRPMADGIYALGLSFVELASNTLLADLSKSRADTQARVQRAMMD